jgi:hypothetical protein
VRNNNDSGTEKRCRVQNYGKKRCRIKNYERKNINVNAKIKNKEDTGGRIKIHRENFTQKTTPALL